MDGKIKIAVCFSGQFRCHYKIINFWVERFFNVFDKNMYDIYIFMYSNNQYIGTLDEILKNYDGYNLVYKLEDDLDFTAVLKSNIFNIPTAGLVRGGHNQLLREFHCMDMVINLKSEFEGLNNIKFDYVFRTRYDVMPINNFDVEILSSLDKNKFYLSNHDHHGGLNARFTVCSSEKSDFVYKIINNIEYVEKTISLFSGEPYWSSHLKFLNVDVDYIDFKLGLVRDYDNNLPKHEQGCVSLNGHGVYRFNHREDGKIIID